MRAESVDGGAGATRPEDACRAIPTARTAGRYGAMPVAPVGVEGAEVRWVRSPVRQAVSVADRMIAELRRDGYRDVDIMVLTTGGQHPRHGVRAASGVYYGHALDGGTLERKAVILAVNGFRSRDQERRIRQLGMSRATEILVVCGPS